jgi:hypothetical protein
LKQRGPDQIALPDHASTAAAAQHHRPALA